MPLCSIPLPDVSIAHKAENVTLSATGTLRADIPVHLGTVQTTSELEELVRTTNLWIARTGSCYFDVEISVNGFRVKKEDQMSLIRNILLDSEVWNCLGIRPVYIDDTTDHPGCTRVSIQHPDLSSALVPDTVTVARFDHVSYVIKMRSQEKGKQAKRRANPRKSAAQIITTLNDGNGGSDTFYNSLVVDDQKAVDDFIQQMNLDVTERKDSRRPKRRRCRSTIAHEMIYATHTKEMLETWLEHIMTGPRRHSKYLSIDDRRGKPLSALLPAVFNVPYLQILSERKGALFTIATSLGRMRNAESPSLRRKVEELAARSATTREENSEENRQERDSVRDGIENRLWNLMASVVPTSVRLTKAAVGSHRLNRR